MKLHYHPISTTSRPIMLFAAESGIPLEMTVVDIFTGEHVKPPYTGLNPNKLIPTLEDGDFVLTENSAILKYLADKIDSPAYPRDLQKRARVNERMDWVNTQLCIDLVYGLVYPQIFDTHKRRSDEAQAATLERGRERAQGWLKVLDENVLGPGNNYLCGDAITIADYHAVSYVHLTEVIGSDLGAYPNVKAWLGRMKSLKSWPQVYSVIDGYAASLKGKQMVSV
ncbi:glutathione S-transferase family protein [Variovorax sp. J22R133]|uniref:glutathione S-transferase family protein n=1 Tax=Variovorax brevis TaxID=3053503 RepID=UPI002574E505|nr:glutathione S-transferase family protein [Variovorax sp. J22R133]MDM0117349.1 glutathione S-transferase family protein [Variovorax sp. J22R133]